jgi:hypothetical protein
MNQADRTKLKNSLDIIQEEIKRLYELTTPPIEEEKTISQIAESTYYDQNRSPTHNEILKKQG